MKISAAVTFYIDRIMLDSNGFKLAGKSLMLCALFQYLPVYFCSVFRIWGTAGAKVT